MDAVRWAIGGFLADRPVGPGGARLPRASRVNQAAKANLSDYGRLRLGLPDRGSQTSVGHHILWASQLSARVRRFWSLVAMFASRPVRSFRVGSSCGLGLPHRPAAATPERRSVHRDGGDRHTVVGILMWNGGVTWFGTLPVIPGSSARACRSDSAGCCRRRCNRDPGRLSVRTLFAM